MPILWQHLFWFFGHPEVYILVLPFFGVITEISPCSRAGRCSATRAWSSPPSPSPRCRSACGPTTCSPPARSLLPFFSGLSMLIAVPTGVKFFNWIGTMWGGQITFPTPMLFAVGFLVAVPARRADRRDAGLAAARLPASPTRTSSSPTSTTCCSAARCSPLFAGIYYWFPKFTGGAAATSGSARSHFWLMFVGFNLTFLVQHVLGARGHAPPGRRLPARATGSRRSTSSRRSARSCSAPRRCRSSWNVWRTLPPRHRRPATTRGTATPSSGRPPSPPPPHNFDRLPPIRSNRPVWDHAATPTTPDARRRRSRRRSSDALTTRASTTPFVGRRSGFDLSGSRATRIVGTSCSRPSRSSASYGRPVPCCSRWPAAGFPSVPTSAGRPPTDATLAEAQPARSSHGSRRRACGRSRRRSAPRAGRQRAAARLWSLLPGAVVLAFAVVGFIRQSRDDRPRRS